MRRQLAGILFVLLTCCAGLAQSTFRGGLAGTVLDPQGAIIPGAAIRATNIGTAVIYKTVSTSSGDYSIQDLPLGDYNVTVTFPGFASVKVDLVRISAGV